MNLLKYPLLLLALFLAACAPPVLEQATATSANNQADLANTEWYLESFGEPGTESPLIEGLGLDCRGQKQKREDDQARVSQ